MKNNCRSCVVKMAKIVNQNKNKVNQMIQAIRIVRQALSNQLRALAFSSKDSMRAKQRWLWKVQSGHKNKRGKFLEPSGKLHHYDRATASMK